MTLLDDERAAYIANQTERAALLVRIADLQARVDELETKCETIREEAYADGYAAAEEEHASRT